MKHELSCGGVLKRIHFLVAAVAAALSLETDAACTYCDPGVGTPAIPPALVTSATPPQIRQMSMNWAAITGSPSQLSPGAVCASDFKNMMLTRSERATSYILCPQTWILLRSGAGAGPSPNFITISDPPPTPAWITLPNPGMPGDLVAVRAPGFPKSELTYAWEAAEAKYAPSTSGKGIIALNFGHLLDLNGHDTGLRGASPLPADPTMPWIAVMDPANLQCERTRNERSVAHEVGHVLNLCHNSNPAPALGSLNAGQICDSSSPGFPLHNSLHNLMESGEDDADLTIPQVLVMRQYLDAHSSVLDPPGDPGEPEGRIAVLFDGWTNNPALPDFLDIAKILVTDDAPKGGDLALYMRLEGEIPTSEVNVRYWFLLDIDNDPATGGSPTNLVPGSPISGVDLVAEVVRENPTNILTTLYHYGGAGGVYNVVPLGAGALQSNLQTLYIAFCGATGTNVAPAPEPVATSVQFRISNSALVGAGLASAPGAALFPKGLRIQAVSWAMSSGQQDLAPDAGAVMEFPPIVYPSVAHPPAIALGELVSFTVKNITPLVPLTLRLADQDIPIGATTDAAGAATFSFSVPTDLPVMPVLVTVGVQDTNNASTAVSVVEITDPAVPLAINISAGSTNAVLTWNSLLATLQSAETVVGPWTNITTAYSPWPAQYGGQKSFYRVKR
jgi:hypothetical protein